MKRLLYCLAAVSFGVVCFMACKPNKTADLGNNVPDTLEQEIKAATTGDGINQEKAIVYSMSDFSQLVDSFPMDTLPYVVGEELFLGPNYRANEKVRVMIADKGISVGKAFGMKHCQDSAVLAAIKNATFDHDFSLYKRLKSRTDGIEVLIFRSGYTLVIATFNMKTQAFINDRVLTNHEEGNLYYSGGACINQKFNVYNVTYASYESPPFVKKQKMHIERDGRITVDDSESYSSENVDVLDDYTKPYYLDLEPKKWSMASENRARLFTYDFLARIPEVSLPYTSDTFNSHFRVWNPWKDAESKSMLFEDGLRSPQSTDAFFSNDRATVAFRYDAENDQWISGKYFYPLFRFQCGEYVAVGFLYRSFLRGIPAFYFQINTFTRGGEIIDRQVMYRSYFSESRVTNTFNIHTDYTIDVVETIEDFEMMYEEGFETHRPPSRVRKWHFAIENDGTISPSGPME